MTLKSLSHDMIFHNWQLWWSAEARWVLEVLTPATIVFLGDLVDEASEATPEEQARSSLDHLADIIFLLAPKVLLA